MTALKTKKILSKYSSLLIALVILMIICFSIGIPSIKKILALNKNIINERKKLEELYLTGQIMSTAKEKYDAVKTEISILDKVFVKRDAELELITALEKIAVQNQVMQILNIENKKIDETNKVPITIEARGSYLNLLNYLQTIEALDVYINIDNGSLAYINDGSNINGDDKNGQIESMLLLRLQGYIYYQD